MIDTHGSHTKGVQLKANQNISDLSRFSLAIANNGAPSTEFGEIFLPPISVNENDVIWVVKNESLTIKYFGSECVESDIVVIGNSYLNHNGKQSFLCIIDI